MTSSLARPPTAGSNIMTEKMDVESQRTRARTSHINHILDPAGVTAAVLSAKYPGSGTASDPFVIDFLKEDPRDALQFAQWKKWTITILQAFATLAVALVSTAYSGGVFEVIRSFRVSTTVAILGISLFVLGFAIGPLLWAPLSEFYGRQILFSVTYMALTAFNAGAAGSQNIETLIILRFFAGAFGSSPLTNCGGVIADMFTAEERGVAAGIFAIAPFLGPAIGPIAGGFLGEAEGWRWVEGLMAIFTGILWIACSAFVPETYAPVLLRRRAEKLSRITGRVYISKLDVASHGNGSAEAKKAARRDQIKKALVRPWVLLFCEPIVLVMSIYIAVVYGVLYLLFAAFPIVFTGHRGWSPGVSGLAFVGVAIGMMIGVLYAMLDNRRYARVAAKHNGNAPPEARLPLAMVGSVLLPVGLFWFSWTNGPEIHWVVPIIASGFFAAGLVLVFLALLTYLIDSYTVFAASVLAANAILRSLFGAAFPLFATYMYSDLGIHWASTIPAFLALACVPFPLLFYLYGARIRAKCRYAAEAEAMLKAMKEAHGGMTEDQAADEAMQRVASRRTVERVASRRSRRGRESREEERVPLPLVNHDGCEGGNESKDEDDKADGSGTRDENGHGHGHGHELLGNGNGLGNASDDETTVAASSGSVRHGEAETGTERKTELGTERRAELETKGKKEVESEGKEGRGSEERDDRESEGKEK